MRLILSLLAAGAVITAPSAFAPKAQAYTGMADTGQDRAIRTAVSRSLVLLQRSSDAIGKQTACATCHNHSQAIETEMTARAKGVAIDEGALSRQLATVVREIELRRDQAFLQGDVPGAHDALAGIMAGAVAGKAPSTEATDAAVVYLMAKQTPAGDWRVGPRGSFGKSTYLITAQAVQSIGVYAPPALRGQAAASIGKARAWLIATPVTGTNNEALAGRLQALVWSKAAAGEIAKARAQLAAAQRPDGGWARESDLPSDAFGTGTALNALLGGGMKTGDPAYQRGVAFLLKTQAADGSWLVRTRALPIQPPIDGGFPYGIDQWMSSWGTALAAQALVQALP